MSVIDSVCQVLPQLGVEISEGTHSYFQASAFSKHLKFLRNQLHSEEHFHKGWRLVSIFFPNTKNKFYSNL